jgi:hypothetical protein
MMGGQVWSVESGSAALTVDSMEHVKIWSVYAKKVGPVTCVRTVNVMTAVPTTVNARTVHVSVCAAGTENTVP